MNMENGSSSTPSVVPYTNGTATTIGPNKPSATGTQMANAVSMESLDSAISTTNGGGSGGSDPQAQVRTLFVSGLPMDVKPRELYLLFRAYPGYETSQLKLTPSSKNGASKMASTPVGFVTFATRQDADEVRKKLQGVRFDPEQAQTIRLELARSNTKVTKPSKQPSPPNHIVNAAVATANSSVMPALLPPPAPIFSNIAVAQLAAMQQQQQLAAAILLNQQHHDANSSNGTALAQQQQQLFAALEHQRHLSPLINQNGIGDSSAIQHQLAALTAVNANPTTLSALSHAQQAQAVQQLLQHQQNSTAAAAILGPAGTIPSTNTGNPQFAAVAALAAAQNHNHLVATSSAALANGFPGNGGTAAGGWQTTLGMNGQTTGPCSTIFIANLGPAATNSPQIVEEELKSLFGIFQGFSRIRMHTKSGAPVAFIEYAEVGQAVGAMMTMQGYCLAANGGSGPGGGTNGIRIEFAKTRMGDTSTAQQRTDGGGK